MELDFQPKPKWDYCHGLELGAMLDVHDTYGDKKTTTTPLHTQIQWCTPTERLPLMLTDYSLIASIPERKFPFRIYEQTKDPKYKKALDLLTASLKDSPVMMMAVFGTRKFIRIRCGWTDFTWEPLYAEHAFRNNLPKDYADIINQFVTCARHTYDPKTDFTVMRDVSRTERWADPVTGSRSTAGDVLGVVCHGRW